MNSNTQEIMQVLNIPIEDIIPNRFQPRLSFDEEGLKELANSIKEHGIIQPLVVRKLAEKYEIVAGERRYKAAKMAGLTQVPAIITNMDDQRSAEAAIVENVQRRDLSAIEEAKSYQALLDKDNITQEQLAKRMGLSQSAISNKLRLLTLSEAVQNALIDGRISERHARSLLLIENPNEQEEWLNKIIDERLTVRELDKQLKSKLGGVKNDIPLVDAVPSLEKIKENATDIINPSKEEKKMEKEKLAPLEEPKKIPNKFFNFLEDESASMETEEDESDFVDIPVLNNVEESEPIENTSEIITPTAPTEPLETAESSTPILAENNIENPQETINVTKEPVAVSNEPVEEIEMLDFEVTPITPKEPEIVETKIPIANGETEVDKLFNKFIEELKNKNYNAMLTKEDNEDNTMYIVNITK